jgi:hypothetical protein
MANKIQKLYNYPFFQHFLSVTAIVALATISFGKALSIHPADADNLIALSLASKQNPFGFFTGCFVSFLPGYRPVAYLFSWMQYQIVHLNIPSYFFVNVSIVIACIIVIYLLVYLLSKSKVAAFVVSVLMIVNPNFLCAIVWIGERQSSLALLFGLLALFLAITEWKPTRNNFVAWMLIFLFLLCSSLCKEYGLAFSPAIIIFAITNKNNNDRAALISIGILSMAAYSMIRIFLAGSANVTYNCEDMGFFTSMRVICYNAMDLKDSIVQYLYNMIATFFNILLPGLINTNGMLIKPSMPSLLKSALFLCLAIIGFIKAPRPMSAMAMLIFCNAVLSFMIFRARNQIIGEAALYIIIGTAITHLIAFTRYNRWKYIIWTLCFIACIRIVLSSIAIDQKFVNEFKTRNDLLNSEAEAAKYPNDIDPIIAKQINDKYQ